jgi:LPXTG-motif cell wall-anchored protein
MIRDNNAVFVIGLLFVIGGYLLIRRKLKESIGKRSLNGNNGMME